MHLLCTAEYIHAVLEIFRIFNESLTLGEGRLSGLQLDSFSSRLKHSLVEEGGGS